MSKGELDSTDRECRPAERDMMESPRPPDVRTPDLRCSEHKGVCEVVHALLNRVAALESRVRTLEEGWQ